MDVLGTKEAGRAEDKDVVDFMQSFHSVVQEAKTLPTFFNPGDEVSNTYPKFDCLALSDTIIIEGSYEKTSIDFDAINIIRAGNVCAGIMKKGFESKKMFLRGGIGIGDYYRMNDLIVGKAVTEVAEYYDKMQWIGVSLVPKAHYILSRFASQKEGFEPIFRQHEIQLKDGIERDAWALNWPRFMHTMYIKKPEIMEQHRELIVSKCLDANLSNALKWRNTLNFWDTTLKFTSKKQKETE